MHVIRVCTTVIARFFISLVFLGGAVNKILHWHETERFLMNILCEWQAHLGFSDHLQDCLTVMIPWTPLLLLMATLFELVGGLSVLLGMKEKLGASLLVLFLIPSTILMHQFWFIEGPGREVQLAHFLKNLAILGGLLMIILNAPSEPKNSFKSPF
jgi:uncharacterized membrane protein YphA (DoxX/SURF4 family)